MLSWKSARRLVVGVIGSTIVVFGVLLLVLPGPGMVVIPVGLAVLGTEFVWARRLLKRVKDGAVRMADVARREPTATTGTAQRKTE